MQTPKIAYYLAAPLLLLRLRRKNQRLRSKDIRQSIKTVEVQPGFEIDTYWKNLGKLGCGPTIAGYILGIQIFKFDCFGSPKGHYHLYHSRTQDVSDKTMPFAESTTEEQIKRGITEVRLNLPFFLGSCWFVRLRKFKVDQDRLNSALDIIKIDMMALVEKHDDSTAQAIKSQI